jgi:polyferredoxin
MEDLYQFDEEYRDSIATVDAKGKRIWVYPKKPSGHFHNLRIVVSIALLAILFGMPFIQVDGSPLMLIDVFERKFIIFGIHLWPQDFHIVALSMISLVVFIVLFTVVFGRVWCGWACPQTIFMEMVFRKIEYLIEGMPTSKEDSISHRGTAKKS